jgi:succinylarginine dihydrolase
MKAQEANFDGLVGPTHNYAGLSYGNVASMTHKDAVSNPREAARQGLIKMKALHDMGMVQGVLPPQERPDITALRALGFDGDEKQVLAQAFKDEPQLLAAVSSASSMWTANAATVNPSADARDGKVHFTAANLSNKFHRAIEHPTTSRILQAIFHDAKHFVHHPALPMSGAFGDEGAANHTRLCVDYGEPGLQFFVYGRSALDEEGAQPKKFPARHTLETSRAITRLHQLPPERAVYGQQHPEAIDLGAFHNDVVSVGNLDVFFYHERSFLHSTHVLEQLKSQFKKVCGKDLRLLFATEKDVPMIDAVKSYLFNSQLIRKPNGKICLVAPHECEENPRVREYVQKTIGQNGCPIDEIMHFDLRQSMNNGGGPACLRLRVVLTETELKATNPGALMSEDLYKKLMTWVEKHYRDQLRMKDLADPKLLNEVRTALDELTQILKVGSVYPFQN